ncbi:MULTISPECIES: hypothetical protein [Serratia]|uniref:hypothetical protein n=1 Tax=Serratia TaxID=613 RepID=UPI001EE54E99|nr:hypothetical protein [Serratia bockelmannii]
MEGDAHVFVAYQHPVALGVHQHAGGGNQSLVGGKPPIAAIRVDQAQLATAQGGDQERTGARLPGDALRVGAGGIRRKLDALRGLRLHNDAEKQCGAGQLGDAPAVRQ